MTRILALTAIEAPFRTTLIPTQLLRPLCRAQRGDPGLRIDCLALVPWTFFFSLRRPWRGFGENLERRQQLRRELGECGIALHVWPIAFPLLPRQFNLSGAQRVLFQTFAVPVVGIFLLSRRRFDLVISRSYPATILARAMRRWSGIPYVFDLRGMYPEECVNAGAFGPDSASYRSWKKIEQRLIDDAARCVVVSEPFAEHVAAIAPAARIDVIPCCVDPARYRYDPQARAQAKGKHGLAGRFVLLHLGSFGTPGDRGLVAKYLLRFKQVDPTAVLVVASGTPAFGPAIARALRAEGLRPDDYRILHPQPRETVDILALADAGLVLERKVANTKVCLSVKLGEYLASGLPVICTPFVEGAARLVDRYRCGLVVDPDADEPLEKERQFLGALPQLRENGFRLVNELLSLEQCAKRWITAIGVALEHNHERGI